MVLPYYFLAPLTAIVLMAAPAAYGQRSTARQGLLTCKTSASVGLIVGSRQRMRCQFRSNQGWTQNYSGVINRLGLDLGVTAGGVMTWGVLASSSNLKRTALTGRFVGASGDVSLGLGVGANVLVGGSQRSFSLQPLSVEGQVGVNLALGVAGMTLTPTP